MAIRTPSSSLNRRKSSDRHTKIILPRKNCNYKCRQVILHLLRLRLFKLPKVWGYSQVSYLRLVYKLNYGRGVQKPVINTLLSLHICKLLFSDVPCYRVQPSWTCIFFQIDNSLLLLAHSIPLFSCF